MGRKRVKKQTLNEFQAWLQGIKEIQPDDWTPTAEQWSMIYEKILNIKEEVKAEPAQPAQQVMPYIPQMPPAGMPPPPGPPPAVFNPADVEMTEAAKKALAGGTLERPAPTPVPSAAPDGSVTSSFE